MNSLVGWLRGVVNVPSPHLYPEKYCQSLNVLMPNEASDLSNFFNQQDPSHYFHDNVNNRLGLNKIHPEATPKAKIAWRSVTFDKNGEVQKEELTAAYSYANDYTTCERVVRVALKQTALQLGFQNTTQKMGISLFQHSIQPGCPIEGIEYHIDKSSYSTVVMLDDSSQWNGGEFLFKTHDGIIPLVKKKTKQGEAVIFSNRGTMHSVTSMQLQDHVQTAAKRTILTLHVKGNPIKELNAYKAEKNFFESTYDCVLTIFKHIGSFLLGCKISSQIESFLLFGE